MTMLDQKTLLVTGGTGSFGQDFIRLALTHHNPAEVIVYSRDEKKQHDMRLAFDDSRLSFIIGDIRDREQVERATRGVDFVFHAAALKQVPSCEFFPIEAVYTNVLGTHNLLDAADRNGVTKLVVLSTDKAVYPINAMGQTKALMEKLMLARAKSRRAQVTCCGVRYGNVMYSRGSVIPLFVQQILSGAPLTITNPRMTRLLLPLAEAVELVTFALEHGEAGDIFVKKARAATVQDVAQALLNLFQTNNDIDIVGVRAGEKMHEVLVSAEEIGRADEFDDYYRVRCQQDRNYDEYFVRGVASETFAREGYTSENAHRLNIREIEQLLLSLPEIQQHLQQWLAPSITRRQAA